MRPSGIEVLSGVPFSRICKYAGQLAVLTQHYNAIFGVSALTQELMLILVIVVNATVAVFHAAPRAMVVTFAFFAIAIYTHKDYGATYEGWKLSWESWQRESRSSAWFRRYCRSYRPPRVVVGSFFYADKSLTLTILSIVLNYTASMALTTREN